MDAEELTWIERAQEGDAWAFEQLVRRYEQRLLGLVCDIAGSLEDGQDVYQEALIAAYRALPRYRGESAFYTWLYRIGVNRALRFRQQKRRWAALQVEETAVDSTGKVEGPEEALLAAECRQQVQGALERASPQERAAFALCHHQGFKITEAAAMMDCSSGTVKSYLFRARSKVKAALAAYMEA
ncbi:MAG: sigma-70 family RNA polymerase sigma factor [Candidatus Latescibacteria bacterium]|nr:sigma-70 family RNA polymerase sigma factor [Candidatus Latescibacterota bacterium]